MNVLSLFDGMSCGQIALNKAGIKYDAYFASEVDKYAIKVAQANYPNTIQIGDVTKVDHTRLPFGGIDLLMGGSPCQGFSFAGKQLNFDDPRSKLFFEFIRLRDELKPKYVLLENVRMKKDSENVITKYMGFSPQAMNSADVSAQNRHRLYWFGYLNESLEYEQIPISPIKDKGIVIKDILEDLPFEDIPNYLNNTWCGRRRGDLVKSVDDPKAHCLTASMWKGQIPTFVKKPVQVGVADNIKGYDIIKRVYSPNGKSPTLTTMQGGHRQPKVAIGRIVNRRLDENGVRKDNQLELPFTKQLEVSSADKSNCLTTVQKDNVVVHKELYRKLTPLECERLQTVPDNYTNHVSKTQRYKMLGNGWTVDMIAHIFKGIKDD
jgi:DNA-cytosine methyltransferase|tara:strand:- start:11841 stop:12974 length:1134 start_codon:yes stop_codon:yes gene_type:complete